jgi:hypothetical protein
MHTLERLPAPAGHIFSFLQETANRLLSWLHAFISVINISKLNEISRIFDEASRHPGTRLLNDHLVWIFIGAALLVGVVAFCVLWQMLQTGIRYDPVVFRKRETDSQSIVISIRAAVARYLRSLVKTLLEGLVMLGAAVVLTMVGYVFFKIAWYSFLASPLGQHYARYFPYRAQLVNMVLGRDLFLFPAVLTEISFSVGMFFSACFRLLHITRYAYLPRGPVGKIVLFALPLNVAAAVVVRKVCSVPHWVAAYFAVLIPTLLVFSYCFRSTNRLLPELGTFFSVWKRKRGTPRHVIYLRGMNAGKKVLEFDPLNGNLTGKSLPADDGIDTQGLFLTRSGHEFVVYRYGHELFFQVDDREVPLQTDMSVQWEKKGRFGRRFELYRAGDRLFRLAWSVSPLFGSQAPTAAFFDAFDAILKSRTAFENAFMVDAASEQAI